MSTTAAQPKARKTTKTQMREAIDSFIWTYDWLTGGTQEETRRQAPHGIKELEVKAKRVAELWANAGKLALADAYIARYASKMVPERLERYRGFLPADARPCVVEVLGRDGKVSTVSMTMDSFARSCNRTNGYASDTFMGRIVSIEGVPVVNADPF